MSAAHDKIEDHGRFAYSNILERPQYEWPNGTKLAVYTALNMEVFRYGKGKGAGIAPPDQAESASVYSWREYGNRVGFWRLAEMFDELGIPCQAQLNTALYDHAPDICAKLRARGDEFLGHGHTNSDEQGGLPEAEERALMQDCMNRIKAEEGEAPIGWMSPWLSNSAITADLLEEIGYKYFMDWTTDDQPIWFKTRSGGKILSMPYPVECNDNRALVWFRYTSQEFADMLIDQFDEMLRQAECGTPVVCPISLHPFSVGRPYRMPALRRVYEHILEHQDRIWLTKPIDIYNHIESLPAGIVPGS